MAALTADRKSIYRPLHKRNFPVAAGVNIRQWAGVVVGPDGLARPARVAATDKSVGVAIFAVNNTLGAASALSVECTSSDAVPMGNSSGGDLITLANVGDDCYWVDDQTVALTSATNTRSRAGRIHNVDAQGVWVHFDR